ncbi:Trk system potassium uptake protein TrkA [Oxobacter pfennigii]|uniref:Trk system potassium uptake protein TrkA n=1 Tax=Oxobacter pfennigii TaxID=36849 RepID=A0A0N8NT41_9CLOT|nr:TrkA family potassium uptake protein [Oxobacter pfennigii]KPU43776.1 Trk system potassium uptake protein TrkA [Oxobacter pfennigii]
MHIIVIGCNKVGSNLAKALSEEGHDVVVIDSNPENFDQLGSGFNGITISGVPLDEDILRSAGIERANVLAAVTPDDNMNVVVSQIARDIFNVPRAITRVYDPERSLVFQQMGFTTICPTNLVVAQVKNIISQSSSSIWQSFGNKDVSLRYTAPDKKFIGKFIKSIVPNYNSFIFGVIKGNEFIFATPNLKVDDGDTMVVAEYL